jgi:hypothetical protein
MVLLVGFILLEKSLNLSSSTVVTVQYFSHLDLNRRIINLEKYELNPCGVKIIMEEASALFMSSSFVSTLLCLVHSRIQATQ